ncbi:uncharacterized protein DS421_12g376240 [Arachis hypogaea]|nr:uncharacterized protein DS421_12g376240 [Arachis hypogaea]
MASNADNGENNTGVETDRSCASKKIAKNTAGNRSDKAGKHGISVDGDAKKIKCKYCDKVVTGGVYRLKHHLAGTKKDVEPCMGVSDEGLREEACDEIASFIYNNAIPFNVARSEEYHNMFEKVARHGLGFKPPSYDELRGKLLKKVESTKLTLEHKAEWKKTGCTIMTDGWTDKRRRTILNFLVNSPKGTVFLKSINASDICKTAEKIFKMIDEVVEEVGEENVVQVVTDNAANYKKAGQMLMEKRKNLYWTPCAAHCIDLMLEDFEKKLDLHKDTIAKGRKLTTYIYSRTSLISLLQQHTKGRDLVRPGMTRFATFYLTLGSLNEKKNPIIRMFISDEWKESKCSKTRDGKNIENIILDKTFWGNIIHCLRGAYPLLHVLRIVDSEGKAAMGYMYSEIDRAKEKIKDAFQSVELSYKPLWDIIDARWDKQLFRPLHAASYYLNPQIHYSPNFKVEYDVKKGLYDCLDILVGDSALITIIDSQLEDFKSKAKFFGRDVAKNALKTKTPSQWWDSYGDEHPELQKFAIRVLSLTCSSSGCERNWSAFEMVHTKRRNRLKTSTMNDVVFVMTNSRLARKKPSRNTADYSFEDLDSDEEWIVEDENMMENMEEFDTQNGVNLAPQEDRGKDGGPLIDLEIPLLDDDAFNELLNFSPNENQNVGEHDDHDFNKLL